MTTPITMQYSKSMTPTEKIALTGTFSSYLLKAGMQPPSDQCRYATFEDLILCKLVWSKSSDSEKQMGDVLSVISMMGDELDWTYLQEWAPRLEVKLPNKTS